MMRCQKCTKIIGPTPKSTLFMVYCPTCGMTRFYRSKSQADYLAFNHPADEDNELCNPQVLIYQQKTGRIPH